MEGREEVEEGKEEEVEGTVVLVVVSSVVV